MDGTQHQVLEVLLYLIVVGTKPGLAKNDQEANRKVNDVLGSDVGNDAANG
jgi:hypothetical protein